MGVGAALMEALAVDARYGYFVNHDLGGYEVPVHGDIPHQEVIFLDYPDAKSSLADVASSQPSPAPKPSPNELNANSQSQISNANSNANSSDEESGDENDESGNADSSQPEQTEAHGRVAMTPEIDAGFAQLARERIARNWFRFYVWLPIARAETLWFDTHSQYWPFDGELLPLDDLDHATYQHIWLPLFCVLTAAYSLLGVFGGWLLWASQTFAARRWLLLTALIIFLRLAFFSFLENPEPRYTVEFFPFLSVFAGVAITQITAVLRRPRINADSRG